MALAASSFAFIGSSSYHPCPFRFHTCRSLDLAIPSGPGQHGRIIGLDVFTGNLATLNRFSPQFGIGTMDDSLDLWSVVEDLDSVRDTSLGSSLPLPSGPTSAPQQRELPPQGPHLASPFQVSDLGFRPSYLLRGSGRWTVYNSAAFRYSAGRRFESKFVFSPLQPLYRA